MASLGFHPLGDRPGELLRRSLVLVALMFWQGGFTFYAAVVVPVGQAVLGSHRKQGMITREVTVYLNLTGAAVLVPLAWDVSVVPDRRRRRTGRAAAWLVMALAQGYLFWMHTQLSALFDPNSASLLDATEFRSGHRWYLWVSTGQWAAGVVFAVLTVWAWSDADRARGGDAPPD